MKIHPYAAVFPDMDDATYRALVDDIAANGLRLPITLYDGQILDGRNRYRACVELGIEPATEAYKGTDPIDFVVSLNLRRRHLNESQIGMIAGRAEALKKGGQKGPKGKLNSSAELFNADPDEAQRLALNDVYKNGPKGAFGRKRKHKPRAGSMPAIAATHNVSRATVGRARKVLAKGTAELQAAVDRGNIRLNTATKIANLPAAEQGAAVAREAERAAGKPKAAKGKPAAARAAEPPAERDAYGCRILPEVKGDPYWSGRAREERAKDYRLQLGDLRKQYRKYKEFRPLLPALDAFLADKPFAVIPIDPTEAADVLARHFTADQLATLARALFASENRPGDDPGE
jgi:hypothetical protein